MSGHTRSLIKERKRKRKRLVDSLLGLNPRLNDGPVIPISSSIEEKRKPSRLTRPPLSLENKEGWFAEVKLLTLISMLPDPNVLLASLDSVQTEQNTPQLFTR